MSDVDIEVTVEEEPVSINLEVSEAPPADSVVTESIQDNATTLQKLSKKVQQWLGKAKTAVQPADLAPYAKKSQVPTSNKNLTNDAGYTATDTTYQSGDGLSLTDDTFSLNDATKASLHKADTALQEHQDLSDYAKVDDVPTSTKDIDNYMMTRNAQKVDYTLQPDDQGLWVSTGNGQSSIIRLPSDDPEITFGKRVQLIVAFANQGQPKIQIKGDLNHVKNTTISGRWPAGTKINCIFGGNYWLLTKELPL